MTANSAYGAILFDGEGVVFDTEGIWDLAQAEFLLRRGIVYDRATIKPLLAGRSQVDGMSVLVKHYGLDGKIDAMVDERQSLFWRHLHSRVLFMDGFEAWWARTRDGSKRALATSMPRDMLDVVEQRLRLSQYFSKHVFSISDIDGASKPAPDLFLFAARKLGVEPARCVVIEDSPVGIDAARRAGMKSIGLATTFARPLLSCADRVFERWDQIDAATLTGLFQVS